MFEWLKSDDENSNDDLMEIYGVEIKKIKDEIDTVNKKIKFYEGKRRVLENWLNNVMVSVKMEEEDEKCLNCKYYRSGNCLKYESSVNKDATCVDFMWNV